MAVILRLIAAALVLASCGTTPPDTPSVGMSTLATTQQGEIEGFTSGDSVLRFYGVPYAAPPVGNLRWKRPQPAANHDTVLRATDFAPGPMQHNVFGDMMYRSEGFSEDCLYLNIWAPEGKRSGLPVLLYFYGGGLVAGDGSETRYDGSSFAREGIIVVTVNYRLNVFGFMAHPELSEEANGISGNYGYYDQLAALQWVSDNVTSFGGDPKRITIGGESAGAMSVSTLLGSPLTEGLIAGAIGQSGASIERLAPPFSLDSAEAIGLAFAKTSGANSLAELRAIPAEQLYQNFRDGDYRFRPVVDGELTPEPVEQAYLNNKVAAVPLLGGWNSRESGPEGIIGDTPTPASLAAGVRREFGGAAAGILATLPQASEAEVSASAQSLAGNLFTGYSTWRWLQLHARHTGAPTYRYYFTQPRPGETGGARHAADLPYAFGALKIHQTHPWTPADEATSATMVKYFANFIKSGNPNGDTLPQWDAIDPQATGQPVLEIGEVSRASSSDEALLRAMADAYNATN